MKPFIRLTSEHGVWSVNVNHIVRYADTEEGGAVDVALPFDGAFVRMPVTETAAEIDALIEDAPLLARSFTFDD